MYNQNVPKIINIECVHMYIVWGINQVNPYRMLRPCPKCAYSVYKWVDYKHTADTITLTASALLYLRLITLQLH